MPKETKSISVHSSEEIEAINFWGNFAWELFNTQAISFGQVKLTFQRDSSIPRYDEIVALEQKYLSMPSELPKPIKPEQVKIVKRIFLSILGFMITGGIYSLFERRVHDIVFGMLGLAILLTFFVAIPIITIRQILDYRKKMSEYRMLRDTWEDECKRFQAEKAEILNTAHSMLQST